MFACGVPCEASELVHFRNHIGEQGIELILVIFQMLQFKPNYQIAEIHQATADGKLFI